MLDVMPKFIGNNYEYERLSIKFAPNLYNLRSTEICLKTFGLKRV
jgi:hypothetical protein